MENIFKKPEILGYFIPPNTDEQKPILFWAGGFPGSTEALSGRSLLETK